MTPDSTASPEGSVDTKLNQIIAQNSLILSLLRGEQADIAGFATHLKTSSGELQSAISAAPHAVAGVHAMASPPVNPFTALEAQITATIGVEHSAITLINGFAAQITTAVNNALAGGATAAQIAAEVAAQVGLLQTSATSLATAVAANQPPAPTVPPVTPTPAP